MTTATLVVAALALGLSMLTGLLIVIGSNRLRRVRPAVRGAAAVRPHGAVPARDEPSGERQASPAAEVLERIIQRRMADDARFSGQDLDFGTSPDGSLEIWWNGQAYSSVDQLPDVRLRELIGQAIAEFNRGEGKTG